MSDRLPPGSTIGILGGGQLGRMLAMAAARLGFRVHVYEPAEDCPASHVARHTRADYADRAALETFARSVDVVTYEFENIPEDALDAIEALVPIRPSRHALRVSQDRVVEKDFLRELGLDTAPYAAADDLDAAIAKVGIPAILKTRRFGYDGKGQVRIASENDIPAARAEITTPAILEGMVEFEREISVIAARGLDGTVSCYDPGENVHREGILRTTTVPAAITRGQATDAVVLAGRILNALDYVGVLGVELFVAGGRLLVNEIAPRVHNSGHWTEAACLTDQFEQHIRAIAGWRLGDGQRHSDAVMSNLIGDEVDEWPEAIGRLQLYGKTETRPGRKMGHVTKISPRK